MRGVDEDSLGGTLRRLRTARGLSLAQTARLVGVSKASVADWETGRHAPGGAALARLLDALGADADTRGALLSRVPPALARSLLGNAALGSPALGSPDLGPPVEMGGVLRALRARRGVTQAAAARSLGVAQSAWAKWETGGSAPSEETIARALDALDASEDERGAMRAVAWSVGEAEATLDALDARIVEIEHDRPIAMRDLLLLGIEAEAWRRAARGEARAEALLGRVVGARAHQALIRGDLGEIESLARRAVALAAAHDEPDAVTAAVYALEWSRQRAPGGAPASARRLGEWARRMRIPNHRYWLVTVQAQAIARAGEPFQAVEILDRLDREESGSPEAAFHRTDRAEALLVGDEPERAVESLRVLGDEASPLVAAKVALALGEEPDADVLDGARRLAGHHWLNRTEFDRIERGLAGLRRGRTPRFR